MTSIIPKSEVGKAIGQAIGALFSKPTEALGELFADKIQYLRWKSSVRVMTKAKVYAERKGLADLNMPSLKFFLPWIEGSSLEEDEENSLEDLWANLLVSEALSPAPNSLIFVDIIKKLRSEHAVILKSMFEEKNSNDDYKALNYSTETTIENVILSLLGEFNFPFIDADTHSRLTNRLFDALLLPGTHIYHCSVYRDDKGSLVGGGREPFPIDFNTGKGNYSSSVGDSLKSLGLLTDVEIKLDWGRPTMSYEVSVFGYILTRLGWEFVFSCGIFPDKIND